MAYPFMNRSLDCKDNYFSTNLCDFKVKMRDMYAFLTKKETVD